MIINYVKQWIVSFQTWCLTPSSKVMFDRQLIWISLSLMLIGLVMVASASLPISARLADNPFHFMLRHMVFIFLALCSSAVVLRIKLDDWLKYSSHLLLLSLVLLIAVLVVGRTINGATRWLPLGIFNLQPAEVAKLSLFVFISGYLVRRHGEVRDRLRGFVKPLAVLITLGFFLLLQPDFGSVIVMLITTIGMLFIAGARLWQFIILLIIGLFAVVALILSAPYRMRRMISFLDPWENPFGSGYQLTQSLMAFGRGSWFGEGLGNSIQKLEYLPEAHTDFIFAVIAEELGFIGVTLVLVLIFALVFKALFIGRKCLQHELIFGGFLAFGIGIWFAFQTVVNVGAAAGIIPTKGLTLPLISYGGSSLVIMSIAASLLIRIDYECRVFLEEQQSRSENEK